MRGIIFCCTTLLTAIEVAATWALTLWVRSGNVLYCFLGLYLFATLGLAFGMTIRYVNHMNTVSCLWQTTSIVGVSIVSMCVFKESTTTLQLWGVVFAIVSSLCFIQ